MCMYMYINTYICTRTWNFKCYIYKRYFNSAYFPKSNSMKLAMALTLKHNLPLLFEVQNPCQAFYLLHQEQHMKSL